jgi:biotin-(acetyl-CoA carboxylase) ligase
LYEKTRVTDEREKNNKHHKWIRYLNRWIRYLDKWIRYLDRWARYVDRKRQTSYELHEEIRVTDEREENAREIKMTWVFIYVSRI